MFFLQVRQVDNGGDDILCRAVGAGGKLERIEGRAVFGCNMALHQPLEALHHDGSQCYWAIIIQAVMVGLFATGMMVTHLKHARRMAWSSEVSNMSMRTRASWSAHP